MEARFMIMPTGQSKNFMLLLMLMQMMMLALSLGGVHALQEWKTLSEKENLEMEAQLKVINKPSIKSFQTKYGDVLDCIDIYKQHAFDHHLLKDHKIQMRPKRIQKEIMGGKSSLKTKQPRYLPKNIKCPPGSVLIKRTTKEELIKAKEMKSLGFSHPTSSHLQQHVGNYGSSVASYKKQNFGAKAVMNVWNPSVPPTQFSEASIWVENGLNGTTVVNAIQAGWRVQPSFFNDNQTRLYSEWTGEQNSGCSNYLCPGFVQVSQEISLGIALQSSTYGGTQQEIEIGIFKDGEWWLKFGNKFVGYWPQKLFSTMKDDSSMVFFGGQVYCPPNEPCPTMGSGHFYEWATVGKTAYIQQMRIWDGVNLVYPIEKYIIAGTNIPQCYHADAIYNSQSYQYDLYYGGPDQCKI